jgi:hypothetical protein
MLVLRGLRCHVRPKKAPTTVLPTARWRALDTRSQVAEPRLLFFALKKSFAKHSALAVHLHGAGSCDLSVQPLACYLILV